MRSTEKARIAGVQGAGEMRQEEVARGLLTKWATGPGKGLGLFCGFSGGDIGVFKAENKCDLIYSF